MTTIGQAVGAFIATNIDGFLVLLLLVARAAGRAGGLAKVFFGQFLGFAGILVLSGVAALVISGLPDDVRPWLGLPAIALGIRAALQLRRGQGSPALAAGPSVLSAATITFTKGGDNISVYVPIFAVVGLTATCTYVVVFLVLLALMCGAGWLIATKTVVAPLLAQWGPVLLPAVLIGAGVLVIAQELWFD
ncbi:cadmium resistance transporter [Kutzneria buriramensis]|uniref:Cadmium resistance protein CadD (Predicted permease) n=1 Tax=Kutzneria buriramensis TaxID=1045776 RepID=A0A3E0H7D9_9PSEU|nr:cadmium resistance transporter [Kutzneria buriramensis]REH39371.1 cadmium resistance protein CadD (predicted permease) [Kutzneria buriramensis]